MSDITDHHNTDKPFLIHSGLSGWEALHWSLDDWVKVLPPLVDVRVGLVQPNLPHPQWERYTNSKQIPTKELFSQSSQQLETWAYYDYKYMHQVMPDLCSKFPWDDFGFAGRDGQESTLWVGTSHAHTPCHRDTYGCNLVAQLYGEKTWTLFPPEQFSVSITDPV